MDSGPKIFAEDEKGLLVAMRPSAPPSEDELQDLIARFPEILSEFEKDLLLVKREKGVPDALSGAERWSLDHLFITKSAVPVLVEVKRASDTRIRREVIGQILDYAANGVVYWPLGALQAAFEETCSERNEKPEEVLAEFLDDNNTEQFWSQAQSNLEAGRLKLIVAADKIPAELARVIEFLNDQMRAEVRAIELRYFLSAEGRRTLAPRFFGETERTKVTKSGGASTRLPPISIEEWLSRFIAPLGEETLSGVREYMTVVESHSGEVYVASSQGSIPARFLGRDGNNIFPLSVDKRGRICIRFSETFDRIGLRDESVRQAVYDRFVQAVGPLSTRSLRGYPSFGASKINDPIVARAYRAAAKEYIELACQSGD